MACRKPCKRQTRESLGRNPGGKLRSLIARTYDVRDLLHRWSLVIQMRLPASSTRNDACLRNCPGRPRARVHLAPQTQLLLSGFLSDAVAGCAKSLLDSK